VSLDTKGNVLSKTPVEVASLVLQCSVLAFGLSPKMPKAQPGWIQYCFIAGSAVIALVFTSYGISIGPGTLPFSPVLLSAILVVLAVASPVAGKIESKCGKAGNRIFTKDRFIPHLASNFFGALAVAAFVLAARSTPGFDEFAAEFKDDSAFNLVLPLTVVVIFAFARVQQIDRCPQLDELVEHRSNRRDKSWQKCIEGHSLKHLHQILNISYLIVATFAGSTMILYLFAYTMKRAQKASPLPFTWQMGMAIVALLLFLFACSIPEMKKTVLQLLATRRKASETPANDSANLEGDVAQDGNETGATIVDEQSAADDGNSAKKRKAPEDGDSSGLLAVYLTFLTGTPAVLVFALIWFALLRTSMSRNIAAVSIIGAGYLAYTAITVLCSRRDDDDGPRLHYFSAAAFAVVLIILGGAMYYS
jgi:hypothetical protein